ncbi:PIG-L deacetylase family protein [candidate division KSB1 bacterium]
MIDFDKIKKVLVFCAHPDDEIIGAGGTIKKMRMKNVEVGVVTFTLGGTSYSSIEMKENMEKTREDEAKEAEKCLDISFREILNIPTQGIYNTKEIFQKITRLIRKHKPDIIFNHWSEDKHRDHRAISLIVDEARWKAQEDVLADLGETWFTPLIFYYEVLDLFPHPSLVIDITDTIEFKKKAITTQKSQFTVLPGILDYVDGLAKVRGLKCHTKYAEAFMVSNFYPSRA